MDVWPGTFSGKCLNRLFSSRVANIEIMLDIVG